MNLKNKKKLNKILFSVGIVSIASVIFGIALLCNLTIKTSSAQKQYAYTNNSLWNVATSEITIKTSSVAMSTDSSFDFRNYEYDDPQAWYYQNSKTASHALVTHSQHLKINYTNNGTDVTWFANGNKITSSQTLDFEYYQPGNDCIEISCLSSFNNYIYRIYSLPYSGIYSNVGDPIAMSYDKSVYYYDKNNVELIDGGSYTVNAYQQIDYSCYDDRWTEQTFSGDGRYIYHAFNKDYTIIIDTTAPIINGVDKSIYENQTVTPVVVESNIKSITTTFKPYNTSNTQTNSWNPGQTVYLPGDYSITVQDMVNKITTKSFTIADTKTPSFFITDNEGNDLFSGQFTNSSIAVSCEDDFLSSWSYSLDNKNYTNVSNLDSTLSFEDEGTYYFKAIDTSGNQTPVHSITIDKTNPTLTLVTDSTKVESGTITNKSIYAYATDNNTVSMFVKEPGASDYSAYQKNTTLADEGTYYFKATDAAGNEVIKTIIIDLTNPRLIVSDGSELENNSFTNKAIFADATDLNGISSLEYKKPDSSSYEAYTANTELTSEGTYFFKATDDAGNVSIQTITIDLANPLINLYSNSNLVPSGTETRFNIYAVALDDNLSSLQVLKPNTSISVDYVKNTTLSDEGKYVFVATDKAGNKTTATIIIDKTAPTGTLSGTNNNGYTNSNVFFTWSESNCTATLDGNNYAKEQYITNESVHTIELIDKAGNTSTYSFTIDKTAPEGVLTGVTNNGITKTNVSFYWSESSLTATINGNSYAKNVIIEDEGNYEITLVDLAGNETVYTFTIDKTAPEGSFIGLSNNDITNNNVSFTWDEANCTATLDDNAYLKGTVITSEGTHKLTLTDAAGNSHEYTFTIDKTAPTGSLSGVQNDGVTKSDVTFTWSEKNCTVTLDDEPYVKDSSISSVDQHEIVITDLAGNKTSYVFEIDKTAPVFELYSSDSKLLYNSDSSEPTVLTTNYKNGLYFTWDEANCNATLDGLPYSMLDAISLEGAHTFTISDKVGNSSSYIINLDFTGYTNNYNYFRSNNFIYLNHWYETYTYYWSSDSNSYKKQSTYSYASYTSAYSAATSREFGIIETGVFNGTTIYSQTYQKYITNYDFSNAATGLTYYIYKDASGNPYAYFSTQLRDNMISQYATASINERWKPSTPATPAVGESMELSKIFINGSSFSFAYKPVDGTKLYVNNGTGYLQTSYSTVFTTEGIYQIMEIDPAGNEQKYTLVLDNSAPEFKTTDLIGNSLPTIQYYFASQTTVKLTSPIILKGIDAYDENCILYVDGVAQQAGDLSSGLILNTSGTHNVYLIDASGNKTQTIQVIMSLEKVDIKGEDVFASDNQTLLGFNLTINQGNSLNSIVNIGISRYTFEDGKTVIILKDDNGVTIEPASLNYFFSTSGYYTIEVTDTFGRVTTLEYEIEKANPQGRLFTKDSTYFPNGTVSVDYDGNIVKNTPAVTSQSVYLTWNDTTCKAYYIYPDGSLIEYTKLSIISSEGTYLIKLTNTDLKSSYFTFTIDRTAPTGSFINTESSTTIKNGSITNKDVYFNWDEENCTASINGISYSKGTVLSNDGTYSINLTDKAGNVGVYSITIKKVPTTVTISSGTTNLISGSYAKSSVTFSWTDKGCSYMMDGVDYSSGYSATVKTEGTHILIITDAAGNKATYSVTIDKTAPIGSLSGVSLGGTTKDDISFTWEDPQATATLDGAIYEKETLITIPGTHSIILYDLANNQTTYTFTIDKTAPEGVLTGVTNNGITNQNVTLSWTERYCTATLDGNTYSSGATIKSEGTHQLALKDIAGNETVYTFIIDKTSPVCIFNEDISKNYINTSIIASWDEANCTATLDGNAYLKGSSIIAEGTHELIITDTAGNSTSYSFTIDKTAPIGTLVGVDNNSITNQNVTFTWDERYCTTTLDGNSYTSGSKISSDGLHTIIITDRAGNTSTYTFTIDKQIPVGTLSGVTDGGITNQNVSFIWSNNASVQLNSKDYIKGSEITAEGSYEILITSLAGNSRTYTFTIDKTAPILLINNALIDGVTNKDVTISCDETISCKVNNADYVLGSTINKSGSYHVEVIDLAGNISTYDFTIDKDAPIGTLSGVINNSSTNTNVTFTWEEQNCTCTLDGNRYTKNVIISTEGTHTLILMDSVGNTSTYTFTIDKTAPTGSLSGVLENGSTNTNVTFSWTERNCTATLDGNTYSSGTTIKSEGTHIIILSDSLGNSSSYKFTIKKTAPIGSLIGVENGGFTQGKVTCTWSENNVTATLDNNNYSKNSIIATEGLHTIILTDSARNQTTYTFTIDKTAPEGVLTGVTNNGITNSYVSFSWTEKNCTCTLNGNSYSNGTTIKTEGDHVLILTDRAGNTSSYTFTIDKTAPEGTFENPLSNNQSKEDVLFYYDATNNTCTLDGQSYQSGDTISSEGTHAIILTDKAGNQTTYTFTIDKTAPTGTLVGVENKGLTNSYVSFTWTEKNCTCTLDGNSYTSESKIASEGKHIIALKDAAGNQTTYTFTIDKTAPTGIFTGVDISENPYTKDNVTFTWNETSCTVTLNGITYKVDDIISEEGNYSLVITDAAGNSITYEFVIDRTAPTYTVDGTIINGNTHDTVRIEWTDSNVTATINGNPYISGTNIRNSGSYTIVLSDKAGNTTTYSFIILKEFTDNSEIIVKSDNTTTTIDKDTTSYSTTDTVILNLDEESTATVNSQEYESGTELKKVGSYTVVITDKYGNTKTIKIQILQVKTEAQQFLKNNIITIVLSSILGIAIITGVVLFILTRVKNPYNSKKKKQ